MRTVRRKVLKGSYTIEASFLLPMILTVIVVIIYLGFYLHDRAVLNCAAYTSALRGSQMINGEDIYSEVEKCTHKLIENRLIGTDEPQVEILLEGDDITVNYIGKLIIPVGSLISSYLTNEQNEILVKATGTAKMQNAVGFIRKCRIISGIGKELYDKR